MIVQHNMASLNTNRQLGITNKALANSTEKLSSGYRVNRAADDAAGLSISEKMRGQIRGLNQASSNAQDGQNLIQTAEGALNEIHAVLQRMRELTVQAATDTNVTADRQAIALELRALTSEVTRIAYETEFNTLKLLSGGFGLVKTVDGTATMTPGQLGASKANDNASKYLQVGANNGQVISIAIGDMSASGLGLLDANGTGKSVAAIVSAVGDGTKIANKAISPLISVVNKAISAVSLQRSKLGALQNRLDYAIRNADNMAENLQASESKIRDVDMADEMVTYSAKSILQQAGQSMLAQANQATQGVLSLLR